MIDDHPRGSGSVTGVMKHSRLLRMLLSWAMIATGLSCTDSDRNAERRVKAAQSLVSRTDSASEISGFLADLRALHGQFTELEGYGWTLESGQDLFALTGSFDDRVVDSLVACLEDEALSDVTVHGKRVPFAVLCYEALKRTAIVPSVEDSDEPWVGAIRPSSSSAEIRAAYSAWSAVVATRSYRRM